MRTERGWRRFFAAGWLVSLGITAVAYLQWRAYVREVEQRAEDAERTRDEVARRRAVEERLRIARELHDVLAHSLSAITVQAGVGLHLLDRDVEQARSALASIKSTSRDALDEVRAVLGVVRGEGDADLDPGGDGEEPRGPTWNLASLPRLAEPLRARGVAVHFDVDPAVEPEDVLPAHVAGIVYRVVQESLTNVGRHAPGARSVLVHVGREGERVRVTVVDDGGPAGPLDANRPGYGLRGMRERVEGTGGTLRTGHQATETGVGFVVDATVPLATPRAPELSGPPRGIPDGEPDNSQGGA